MFDKELTFAKQVAYEAGEIMKKYWRTAPDQNAKADATIVTIADEEVNQMVIERVKEAFPDHAIIGEEASHGEVDKHAWVCDPIDGTQLFISEIPFCVFSLAYVYDGEPKVGVVYDPFEDRLYYGQIGGGSFVNGKSLRVKTEMKPRETMGFDWWPSAKFDTLSVVKKLSRERNAYFISPGSATHTAILVAEGAMVASIFPGTMPGNHDIAAAKVIVEEAGGKVTDMFGRAQRYDQPINGAIVSNGVVHEAIVSAVNSVEEVDGNEV